jgi:hypothetical protein
MKLVGWYALLGQVTACIMYQSMAEFEQSVLLFSRVELILQG